MNALMRGFAAAVLFSAALLPAWAQDQPGADPASAAPAREQDAGTAQDAGKGGSFSLKIGAETDPGGAADGESKARGITITVDGDRGEREEVRVAGEVIERVIGNLEQVLGKLPAEVRADLDEEEMRELRAALAEIESMKGERHIVHRQAEDTVGEIVGALVAIFLLFVGPVLIVAIVSYNNRRKRQLVHQTIDRVIEQGRDVPVELLDALDKGKNGKSALARGTTNIAIGVAVCVWLFMVAGADVATIGLIPLFIGIAQIVVWRLEKPRERFPAA